LLHRGDAEKKLFSAAKHAKSAKKSFIMVFNLRIFARFAAKDILKFPPRSCG
jgi:hypothetical protein